MRMRGFDAVTTDRIRLSIDKFRDDAVPANIKSLKLYNEPSAMQRDLKYRLISGSTEMFRRRYSPRATNMSETMRSSMMCTARLSSLPPFTETKTAI